jgi:hypothetical protein
MASIRERAGARAHAIRESRVVKGTEHTVRDGARVGVSVLIAAAIVLGGVRVAQGENFLNINGTSSNGGGTPSGEQATPTPSSAATGTPDGTPRPAGAMPSINTKDLLKSSWNDGKMQTYPRLGYVDAQGVQHPVLQEIDLGTLGPDVDTIAGIDLVGDIPTGAMVVSEPTSGPITETRVVFIKRTSLQVVQLNWALGGDSFQVIRHSGDGGDTALNNTALYHAENSARAHQKVIYIGDLKEFEARYGANEQALLQALLRAQEPAVPNAAIPTPDFVEPGQQGGQ